MVNSIFNSKQAGDKLEIKFHRKLPGQVSLRIDCQLDQAVLIPILLIRKEELWMTTHMELFLPAWQTRICSGRFPPNSMQELTLHCSTSD